MQTATEIVVSAVKTVFQTYVDSLKKEGKFDKESQLTAFNKARNIVMVQMTNDVKQFIIKNHGDFDTWLSTQIEATIDSLKIYN